MTVRSLLTVLADGKFHSGSELGEVLGISRSAIWKHIRRLEEAGLEVFSVKGRGYRIPGGLDLLDENTFKGGLSADVRGSLRNFMFELTSPSTNEQAMKACQKDDCHGSLYVAEQQTAGRGRRGRTWVSPFGRNLYFSLVWRFDQGMGALEGLSLLVGLALVKALEKMHINGCQLKWPNDLLYEHKKLAGILVEVNGEASGPCQVVIGVGINVDMPVQNANEIDQPWIDLNAIAGQKVSRNKLLTEIINQLVHYLNAFQERGFASLVNEWQQYNAHQDMEVELNLGSGLVSGVCRGVDASGALLVDTEKGREVFFGGEISLRRAL